MDFCYFNIPEYLNQNGVRTYLHKTTETSILFLKTLFLKSSPSVVKCISQSFESSGFLRIFPLHSHYALNVLIIVIVMTIRPSYRHLVYFHKIH